MNSSRRSFLVSLGAVAAALLPLGAVPKGKHPEPRPDIDASKVMTRKQLKDWPDDVKDIYDHIREIPQVADGIGCYCGCAESPNYRSLLTCYYDTGRARGCAICQGEAKLVYGRHKEGQTLDQIRRAIDARYAS